MTAGDLMHAAGNDDVSTRDVTALSDSVADEKCLREWQQVHGRPLWTLHSLAKMWPLGSVFPSSSSLKACLFSCSSLDGPVCIGWAPWFSTKGHVLMCRFVRLRLGAGSQSILNVGDFSSSQWNVIFFNLFVSTVALAGVKPCVSFPHLEEVVRVTLRVRHHLNVRAYSAQPLRKWTQREPANFFVSAKQNYSSRWSLR